MLELYYLKPIEGDFDVDRIIRFLGALAHTIRDPADTDGPFLVCGSEERVAYVRDQRLNNPTFGYPHVGMIRIAPAMVFIGQRCSMKIVPDVRRFAEWMHRNHSCRIEDELGNDWTDRCKGGLDPLYV